MLTLTRLKRLVGDHKDERREPPFVVMTGGGVPVLVGHRVGPVAEPGDRLGERQRGPFGVGVIGSLPPRRHGEDPLVALAAFLASRQPPSTHGLQPLTWLTRRCTSSSVACGTPPPLMDPNRAWIGFMASGMITAGFGIRAVRVSMLMSSTVANV